MSVDDARGAVQAWIDSTNAHDAEAYERAITEDYTWTLWDATTSGRGASIEAWRELWRSFPDLRTEVIDMVAEDDKVALRFRMAGTNMGPVRFRGTSSWDQPYHPTGRKFSVEGAGWFEVKDGRIRASRAFWQPAQMLAQLGLSR